jgi:hypothetical protein
MIIQMLKCLVIRVDIKEMPGLPSGRDKKVGLLKLWYKNL